MEPKALLYLIIGIAALTYLFNQVLEYLNLKAYRKDLPDDVAAFYSNDQYIKSLDYHRERTRFGFITSAFSMGISLMMLFFGGFGMLDYILRPFIPGDIALALAFFGLLLLASDILTLPFQWHSTFVIEEKFGFNKTTTKTFFTDKLKSYLLGGLIGGVLLSLLIFLIRLLGPVFWIWFGIVAALFILLLNMFYTSLILPLFNKLTPLPEGDLKSAIQSFAAKINFPIDNIFMMDGSKRSRKANAFFSGIGKKKKIVLYDTLVSNHTTEELVAVLAHEAGHFKKRHIVWSYVLSVVQIFFTLFILSRMVLDTNLSLALGGSQGAIHLNLLAFGILYSPISGATGLLMSIYSRRNEFEADAFAKENYSGAAMASALKKLSVDSLSNLYPHPAYVFFHYSHPPLLKRLQALSS